MIIDKIIYTRRRTIAIIINNRAEVVVRAPLRAKQEDIDKFIKSKFEWISKKKNEMLKNRITQIKGLDKETIHLLGVNYTINLTNNQRVSISEDKINLPSINSLDNLKNFIVKYAKQYIPKRVNVLARLNGLEYGKVSITRAKTRWGSCGYRNNLNFTYKLILCPIEVVDYVIIHELTHILIKNHSKKFWQKVEEIMPEYKSNESWLKKNRAVIDMI